MVKGQTGYSITNTPDIAGIDGKKLDETIAVFHKTKARPDARLLRLSITGNSTGDIRATDVLEIPRNYPSEQVYQFAAVAHILRVDRRKSIPEIIGALRLLEADDVFRQYRTPPLSVDQIIERTAKRRSVSTRVDTRLDGFEHEDDDRTPKAKTKAPYGHTEGAI